MISGGYRCPLYDDDAAVTTTDLGSDQATHQLDSAFPPGWIGPGRDPWGAAGRSIRSVTARRSSTGPGVAPTFDRSRRTDLQLTHQSMQFRSTVTRDAAFGSALTAQSPWTMAISVLEATGVQHDWLWPIVTEAEL